MRILLFVALAGNMALVVWDAVLIPFWVNPTTWHSPMLCALAVAWWLLANQHEDCRPVKRLR
jgi:hypothetical protein